MEKKVECVNDDKGTSSAEKTNTKLKINHGDCSTTYTFANDKLAFEGKGKAVDQDGWRVDLTGAGEYKPEKDDWKVSATLNVNGKDLGGAKLAFEVSSLADRRRHLTRILPKFGTQT